MSPTDVGFNDHFSSRFVDNHNGQMHTFVPCGVSLLPISGVIGVNYLLEKPSYLSAKRSEVAARSSAGMADQCRMWAISPTRNPNP